MQKKRIITIVGLLLLTIIILTPSVKAWTETTTTTDTELKTVYKSITITVPAGSSGAQTVPIWFNQTSYVVGSELTYQVDRNCVGEGHTYNFRGSDNSLVNKLNMHKETVGNYWQDYTSFFPSGTSMKFNSGDAVVDAMFYTNYGNITCNAQVETWVYYHN